MDAADLALIALGERLKAADYRFVTVTPLTHQRVVERPAFGPPSLASIFGWNRPFPADACAPDILDLLRRAGEIETDGAALRSKIRFSTIDEQLFVHSGFPTTAPDAVFFGPDTYRFVRALQAVLSEVEAARPTILDIGCGSGAGGLFCADRLRGTAKLILCDINPKALRYSRLNAVLNGCAVAKAVESDILAGIAEQPDLIIANPPYLVDPLERRYRHGFGPYGIDLSLRIVAQSLDRLLPGGMLALYTGTPVVAGVDMFAGAVLPLLQARKCAFRYEEIDPDVFGEELDAPAYEQADRIAVVMLTLRQSGE